MSRGNVLLGLARASLEESFGGPKVRRPEGANWLELPGACFVTLKKDAELRGCIGSSQAHRPLFEDVVDNAKAAAFSDPRFQPLSRNELKDIRLEISVLTPLEPLEVADEAQAIRALRPGVDGVQLTWGARRALFIPKMWEELPDPERFLYYLRRKAGLPDQWLPGTRLARFTAESFAEPEARA